MHRCAHKRPLAPEVCEGEAKPQWQSIQGVSWGQCQQDVQTRATVKQAAELAGAFPGPFRTHDPCAPTYELLEGSFAAVGIVEVEVIDGITPCVPPCATLPLSVPPVCPPCVPLCVPPLCASVGPGCAPDEKDSNHVPIKFPINRGTKTGRQGGGVLCRVLCCFRGGGGGQGGTCELKPEIALWPM